MDKQNESITEPNSSMEELKVEEDENVKEISLEDDILGAQSLIMSESDEEGKGDIKSPPKKISPNRLARILDSDDDLDSKESNKLTFKEEKLNRKKVLTIVDSDSDIEQNNAHDKKIETVENSEIEGGKKFKNDVRSKKSKKSKRINSDEQLNKEASDFQSNALKKPKQMFSLVDSDSSDTGPEEKVTENDLEASAREANLEENNEKSTEKAKKPKVIRASAKKALDEMQAIQSEQQRLHREAHISIPYHKPRKHTLDEFLKRRTIIQPQKANLVAAAIQTRNLKMTSEELEEYANLMEERAKEATEFFKSESENEEDIVYKDNEGVMDNPLPENGESVPIFSKQPLEEQSEITQIERAEKSNEEPTENGVQLTEEDLRDILAEEEMLRLEDQQERPTSSKVLVTEVIELPKLDMNTIKTSPVKKHTPRSSFNIKQLLAEKNLSNSPSLSGAPNKLIDLDTGNLIDKKPTGMENLLERLMSTIKAKKVKKSETCNILSIENGKLEMSKVNVTRSETKDSQKDSKPGAAYFELKKNLKDIIRKKRLDELNKKQDDELEFNKCLADEDSEEEETEEILEEEYEPEDKTENNVLIDEEETAAMADNDDEEISAEEENAENETDAEEQYQINGEDEQNNKNTLALEKSQRKSRIITAFDDSEEEGGNDDIDFLKTQPEITQPSLFETQIQAQNSLADEENELLALCSGTFNETPKMTGDALMSQIPITQNCGKPLNDDELMELCSGTFDQPVFTQQEVEMGKISENLKIKAYKILSTDEENDEDEISTDKENVKRLKKFTKTQKKKTKLGFSDDEDDDDEEEGEESHCDDEEDDDNFETAGNEPETFVDYDSEENEILVQMTKNDKVQQAQNFFEKEAELSESEWGSADEDENNLDKYDLELGDEDEFDKEKLQTELGQIHARKMLDEDIREVRKIQELLFEDEEKDGVGRQRTFKWKNAESGFSLEDGRPLDEFGDNQNGDSGDEINEHQWRKVRFEREQFLKEKGLKPDSQDMSTILTNTSLPLNNSMSVAVSSKKIQIITAKKTTVSSTTDTKKGSPFLISKGIASMHKKSVRGSFLVRDKETLNKLAGFTKGSASAIAVSDMDDTAGSVSIKNVRHTNFVFATLTEEEHENLKRKADDLLNSSNENGKDFMKKPKIEPRRDKCFIDQLL